MEGTPKARGNGEGDYPRSRTPPGAAVWLGERGVSQDPYGSQPEEAIPELPGPIRTGNLLRPVARMAPKVGSRAGPVLDNSVGHLRLGLRIRSGIPEAPRVPIKKEKEAAATPLTPPRNEEVAMPCRGLAQMGDGSWVSATVMRMREGTLRYRVITDGMNGIDTWVSSFQASITGADGEQRVVLMTSATGSEENRPSSRAGSFAEAREEGRKQQSQQMMKKVVTAAAPAAPQDKFTNKVPVLVALTPPDARQGDAYVNNELSGSWVVAEVLKRGLGVTEELPDGTSRQVVMSESLVRQTDPESAPTAQTTSVTKEEVRSPGPGTPKSGQASDRDGGGLSPQVLLMNVDRDVKVGDVVMRGGRAHEVLDIVQTNVISQELNDQGNLVEVPQNEARVKMMVQDAAIILSDDSEVGDTGGDGGGVLEPKEELENPPPLKPGESWCIGGLCDPVVVIPPGFPTTCDECTEAYMNDGPSEANARRIPCNRCLDVLKESGYLPQECPGCTTTLHDPREGDENENKDQQTVTKAPCTGGFCGVELIGVPIPMMAPGTICLYCSQRGASPKSVNGAGTGSAGDTTNRTPAANAAVGDTGALSSGTELRPCELSWCHPVNYLEVPRGGRSVKCTECEQLSSAFFQEDMSRSAPRFYGGRAQTRMHEMPHPRRGAPFREVPRPPNDRERFRPRGRNQESGNVNQDENQQQGPADPGELQTHGRVVTVNTPIVLVMCCFSLRGKNGQACRFGPGCRFSHSRTASLASMGKDEAAVTRGEVVVVCERQLFGGRPFSKKWNCKHHGLK